VLGEIKKEPFSDISQKSRSVYLRGFLPAARLRLKSRGKGQFGRAIYQDTSQKPASVYAPAGFCLRSLRSKAKKHLYPDISQKSPSVYLRGFLPAARSARGKGKTVHPAPTTLSLRVPSRRLRRG